MESELQIKANSNIAKLASQTSYTLPVMNNPYVRIIGKRAKKKPNLEELKKIKRTAELNLLFWVMEQTPDLHGNIAVWKSQIENLKLKDNFTDLAGVYEVDVDGKKQLIYYLPKEFTKNYFRVLPSEEIYYMREEDIDEQLERTKDLDLYKDYVGAVVDAVMKEIKAGNVYPNGMLVIRRPKDIRKDSDMFYTTHWKCRTTCCGSRCSSCQIFEFPDYSVKAIEKFFKRYEQRYKNWLAPQVVEIYEQ